jgi:hypothetical protein
VHVHVPDRRGLSWSSYAGVFPEPEPFPALFPIPLPRHSQVELGINRKLGFLGFAR